jgi:hypothetical protein
VQAALGSYLLLVRWARGAIGSRVVRVRVADGIRTQPRHCITVMKNSSTALARYLADSGSCLVIVSAFGYQAPGSEDDTWRPISAAIAACYDVLRAQLSC